jgi:hypothetical protein
MVTRIEGGSTRLRVAPPLSSTRCSRRGATASTSTLSYLWLRHMSIRIGTSERSLT